MKGLCRLRSLPSLAGSFFPFNPTYVACQAFPLRGCHPCSLDGGTCLPVLFPYRPGAFFFFFSKFLLGIRWSSRVSTDWVGPLCASRVHCFLHPQVMELPSLHEALGGRVNQPGLLLPAFMCLPSAHTASSPRPPPLCLVLKVVCEGFSFFFFLSFRGSAGGGAPESPRTGWVSPVPCSRVPPGCTFFPSPGCGAPESP